MNVADLPAKLSGRITLATRGEWDCWEWTGARTKKNYGQVYYSGTTVRVHRLVHELLVGPIPRGMELHHRCENEPCCNPQHLVVCVQVIERVTPTRVQVDEDGHIHRSCKECNRLRKRGALPPLTSADEPTPASALLDARASAEA